MQLNDNACLWRRDVAGNSALYAAATETYLRGVQPANANPEVTATTVIPGACAEGRPNVRGGANRS